MPAPYTPISAPPSPWFGLSFGAQHVGRSPGGGQHLTIIPLPASPVDELTMQARADAIAATYGGTLSLAVDLYRLTVKRNGFMVGILWMMAHGLLGLPLEWQGDPEMIAALANVRDANGRTLTVGDFDRMHPENEAAEIFSDGIGLGIGLGQYLLMCWRCDGVEWTRTPGASVMHPDVETCKRCGARRHERPIGTRQLYQLRWRDPRWLWRNITTGQWYYTGRQAMIPITPGDGEWLLFQTVPDQDIWVHGPWALGTEAAIFARDSRYDMQAISATCAPAHVFQAKDTGGTDPRTRKDVEEQADNLRFQNKLVLPGEWKHEIHAASGGEGGYVGTADRITSWAQAQWEMAITGIQQGTENGTGFANNGVLQRVSRERRAFYAGAWIRQVLAQGLVWWARDNFGGRPCPVGHYDTRSPEDKLAASKADTEEGNAVNALVEGYALAGYELVPAYVEERAQAKGLRVRPKAAPAPAPSEGPGPAPSPVTPPTPPAPPGRIAARFEDEDDEEDGEEDDGGDAARLAAQMNEHGMGACRHGRTGHCDRCGVRAAYSVAIVGGEKRYVPTWRPIRVPAA